MAKRVTMSTLKLDVATVTTAPEFRVSDSGKVVGDLRVSVGGAFWRPKHGQEYLHLTWEQVDDLFKRHGQPRAVGEYKIAPPAAGGYDDAESRGGDGQQM